MSELKPPYKVNVESIWFKIFSFWMYLFVWIIFRVIFKIYFRWKIINNNNFPKGRSCIIAVNHSSYLDPPFAGTACPGRIWYLARDTLMKNKLSSYFMLGMNCIPVAREGNDIRGLRQMIRYLQKGKPVLIFPEGTRSTTGSIGSMKMGLGLLAHKSKVPILPMYISGAYNAMSKGSFFIRPNKIIVEFSNLLEFSELYEQKGSEKVYMEISEEVGKVLYKFEEKYKNQTMNENVSDLE